MRVVFTSDYGLRLLAAGILALLLVSTQDSRVLAKSGQEHSDDARAVLGISAKNPESESRLAATLRLVSNAVDGEGEFRDFYHDKVLEDPRFPRFSIGPYTHRIFFHWGFNRDPKHSDPISRRVEACHWDISTTDAFWNAIKEEQGHRNTMMRDSVGQTLGFFDRRHQRAFASIIYDTHILGDYIQQEGGYSDKPLMNLDDLIADLHQALYSDLRGGDDAISLNKELKAISGGDRERAERMLVTLKQRVSSIITNAEEGFSRRQIEKQGFAIIAPL